MNELLNSCRETLPESQLVEAEWLIQKAIEKGWTGIRLWCYVEATLDDLYGITPAGNLEQVNHLTLEAHYEPQEPQQAIVGRTAKGRARSIHRAYNDPAVAVRKAFEHNLKWRKKQRKKAKAKRG